MSIIHSRIRRRREDRIRQIQSMRWVEKPSAEEKHLDPPPLPLAAQKWDDPEYVWKHRGGTKAWTHTEMDEPNEPRRKPAFTSRLKGAIIISVLMFAAVWMLFQLPYPWAVKGQQWVQDVMTREFNYVESAEWYSRLFKGSPSLLPSFFDDETPNKPAQGSKDKYYVPTTGSITIPFDSSSPGVWIEGEELEPVVALSEGWVIYAAPSRDREYTVIIQHADNMQTVYSNLTDVTLKKNDWVEGGEQIGRMALHQDGDAYQLFFAIKKDEQYLDPQDVVELD